MLLTLAAIPSPESNAIGPFRMYGLMIALGVIAAVWMSRHRWAARGGDPEDMTTIALWAVPAGLIGARLYHVMTDWKKYFPDRPIEALYLWQGGLGIPGGIALGLAVGVIVARRLKIRLPVGLDVVAPAVPLAQAIGRWGNWWNQELFGRPTDLPWALEVSDATAIEAGEVPGTTFHPTFLYESLWNLALVGVLLWIDRRRAIRPGNLFALYIGGYFLGRLWVEAMRSDPASLVLGLRINIWTSLIGITGAVIVLLARGLRRRDDDSDEPYTDGHRYEPVPVGAPAEDAGAEAVDDPEVGEAGATPDGREASPDVGGGRGEDPDHEPD